MLAQRLFLLFFLLVACASIPSLGLPSAKKSCKKKNKSTVASVVDAIFDGLFEGFATFYHPDSAKEGGNMGACGNRESDSGKYVALNIAQFGKSGPKSDWCFKKILIQANGKSTEAQITDACPGCGENCLDLTPAVFNELADPIVGKIGVKWCVLGTPGCGDDEDEGEDDDNDDECT